MNAGKEAKNGDRLVSHCRTSLPFLSGDTPLQEAPSSQRQRREGQSELQLAAAVQTGKMDLSHLIPRLVILSASEFVRDNLVGVVHFGNFFWAAASVVLQQRAGQVTGLFTSEPIHAHICCSRLNL